MPFPAAGPVGTKDAMITGVTLFFSSSPSLLRSFVTHLSLYTIIVIIIATIIITVINIIIIIIIFSRLGPPLD